MKRHTTCNWQAVRAKAGRAYKGSRTDASTALRGNPDPLPGRRSQCLTPQPALWTLLQCAGGAGAAASAASGVIMAGQRWQARPPRSLLPTCASPRGAQRTRHHGHRGQGVRGQGSGRRGGSGVCRSGLQRASGPPQQLGALSQHPGATRTGAWACAAARGAPITGTLHAGALERSIAAAGPRTSARRHSAASSESWGRSGGFQRASTLPRMPSLRARAAWWPHRTSWTLF